MGAPRGCRVLGIVALLGNPFRRFHDAAFGDLRGPGGGGFGCKGLLLDLFLHQRRGAPVPGGFPGEASGRKEPGDGHDQQRQYRYSSGDPEELPQGWTGGVGVGHGSPLLGGVRLTADVCLHRVPLILREAAVGFEDERVKGLFKKGLEGLGAVRFWNGAEGE